MARTLKSPEPIGVTGTELTYTAAPVDGFMIPYRPDLILHVKQGTGARVVTVRVNNEPDGLVTPDRTINVADSSEPFIRLDRPIYRQGDNMIYVDFDAVSNTVVAVFYT